MGAHGPAPYGPGWALMAGPLGLLGTSFMGQALMGRALKGWAFLGWALMGQALWLPWAN